jgi:hypothetical protein
MASIVATITATIDLNAMLILRFTGQRFRAQLSAISHQLSAISINVDAEPIFKVLADG